MSTSLKPDRLYSPNLDEEVRELRFPSGLRVYLCLKPGFKKKYVCYSTFYGSVDSEFVLASGERLCVPDGIAHFLEHTLFETKSGNASDLFAQRGAYSNAATSFTTTSYLFAAADHFADNLELLLRFVENPVFDPSKVEKERGIIEQEIQQYQDSPYWVSYMGLLENLFQKHPLRVDIAGTVESIRRITSETLHQCHRTFYHPSNMILFAVGDIDPDVFFPLVAEKSKYAGAEPTPLDAPVARRIYPPEPKDVFRRETRRRMEVALPKLLIGFKETEAPADGDEFMSRQLASSLALEIVFGRSSPTFQDLYEAKLVLDDFGADYSLGAGIGYGIVGGETPDPDRLRETLLERMETLLDSGISDEDFERAKKTFLGGFVRGFNSLEYIATNYTYFMFHGFDLFRSIDLFSGFTKARLEDRLRSLLDPKNYASYVVLPME